MKVKQDNKNKLSELLRQLTGIDINPNSIFDIQVLFISVVRPNSRVLTIFNFRVLMLKI